MQTDEPGPLVHRALGHMKSSSSNTSSYAPVSTLFSALAEPSLGLVAFDDQRQGTGVDDATMLTLGFLPLALSRSSCCFVLPSTPNALDTFLVWTALRDSQMSFVSVSAKDGKSGFTVCRSMITATI